MIRLPLLNVLRLLLVCRFFYWMPTQHKGDLWSDCAHDKLEIICIQLMLNRYNLAKWLIVATNVFVIGGSIVNGLLNGDPQYSFDEGDFVTEVSGWQLALCAVAGSINFSFFLAWTKKLFSLDSLFWLILVAGFVYLSFDEIFMYHERLDKYLHFVLSIRETPWTDRIDDLLVGLYVSLASLLVVLSARVQSFSEASKRIFIRALFVAAGMVALDIVTNGAEFTDWLFGPVLGEFMRVWLSVIEECFKLIASALLLLGLISNCRFLREKLLLSCSKT